jgi:hypothetical protein
VIPFDAIADPTRTVVTWDLHSHVGSFVNKQLDDFLKGYWRDLQQSQPNHIEIVGEKNTVEGSIRPVAMKYCIPYTLGRGYASIDPRKKMADRFRASGKNTLIILMLSDFDPEGHDIPYSFGNSMLEDFGIHNPLVKKVCLTYEQVIERNLSPTFDMKTKGKRYEKFAAKYVWPSGKPQGHELEAIPVEERSTLLESAIDELLDIDAFNRELDLEKKDAAKLERLRETVSPVMRAALEDMDDESDDRPD